MSGRLRNALMSVPETNPICTAIINQLTCASLSPHSERRAGVMAEALNQSDIANNSAIASKVRVRQRLGGGKPGSSSFIASVSAGPMVPAEDTTKGKGPVV